MSSSRRSSWPSRNCGAAAQLAQRDRGWRSRRRRRGGAAARPARPPGAAGGVPGEPGPEVVGAGQDQGPGLVDRLGPLGAGAALGDHQRPDRLDRAVPALGRAAGPAGLGGPGGADRIQRVGLALPAAVLAVGAVHLHDPDTGRGDVPGQASAVAAGPFDPDQAHGAEPAQPAQQPGIAGRGGRELLDAEQPADRIERGGDMHVGVGVHAAGDGACVSTMVTAIPFCRLRDGTHPLAARTCEPRPLAQARQIRPAAPVGARNLGPGRQIVIKTARAASADSEVRPGPRPPTLRPHQRKTWEAGPEALSTSSLPNPASVEAQTPDVGPERGSAVMGGGRR